MSRGAVVVGVDGTPGSAGALRYAGWQAARRGTGVLVVHVLPGHVPHGSTERPAAFVQHGRAVLESAVEELRHHVPDSEVASRLEVAGDVQGVVDACAEAALVVVGPDCGHAPGRHTASAVAARAAAPVVVVPARWTSAPPGGTVVAGLRSEHNAAELLSHAFEEARQREGRLRLVTAWELLDPYLDATALAHGESWTREGRRVLGELASPWSERYPEVPVDTSVAHGLASVALLTAARHADLLLVSRRRHALPGGHLGGTTRDLLRHAALPVEVVPFTGAEPPAPGGVSTVATPLGR